MSDGPHFVAPTFTYVEGDLANSCRTVDFTSGVMPINSRVRYHMQSIQTESIPSLWIQSKHRSIAGQGVDDGQQIGFVKVGPQPGFLFRRDPSIVIWRSLLDDAFGLTRLADGFSLARSQPSTRALACKLTPIPQPLLPCFLVVGVLGRVKF